MAQSAEEIRAELARTQGAFTTGFQRLVELEQSENAVVSAIAVAAGVIVTRIDLALVEDRERRSGSRCIGNRSARTENTEELE